MRATWLPSVLQAAGLRVELYDGWEARGSESWGPLKGIVVHATAGRLARDVDMRLLWQTGSATAPAPISQLYLERDGTWVVGASGKCNHALTGKAGLLKGVGNSGLIGIEGANDNRGEPWPAAQYDSYTRGVAAICRHMGWTQNNVTGHKEHQPGDKSDPTFDMNSFRAQVAALIASGGTVAIDDVIVLARGHNSGNVGQWQKWLNADGASPALLEDNDFGGKTETATKAAQKKRGLPETGVLTVGLWRTLNLVTVEAPAPVPTPTEPAEPELPAAGFPTAEAIAVAVWAAAPQPVELEVGETVDAGGFAEVHAKLDALQVDVGRLIASERAQALALE